MKEAKTKRDDVNYTVQDKARFFFVLKIEKVHECVSCSEAVGVFTFEQRRDGLTRIMCVS